MKYLHQGAASFYASFAFYNPHAVFYFNVTLTWNFGKLTENVSKKKGVNNDDILTKPAAPTAN